MNNLKTNNMTTAVEWLAQMEIEIGYITIDILKQAKEMEKQQIITAYNKALPFKFGKEYYDETFKKE
ncbi:hypothetical protein [Brevundimonas sp.]|jgi:hypothetical protein|uniref:hypothetical protein n=1 Tax=Brevundimonas sp. TaxID=1871086 RepID=UPI003783B360